MSIAVDERLKRAGILIIDDEPANVRLMERLLAEAGYTNLRATTDPRAVPAIVTEFAPDLVLLDLLMPHRDGVQVMEDLRRGLPDGAYLPILVLTADVTAEARHRALTAGASDFVTKPFDRIEVLLRVRNLLETRRLQQALQAHNERLEAEVRERTAQLLETEKLATMGNLLAGVAHELNNPLSVICGHAALLVQTSRGDAATERGRKIATAADRCVRIIRSFLAMARRQPPRREAVQLSRVVEEAVELLAYELRVADVEVTVDLAADLPPLSADGHQLHQLVVNLVSNAHQALRRHPRPRRVSITTRYDPRAGSAILVVGDNGPGIPLEVQGRIFEAFFTTKGEGEGTGLGLSLCRGIVEGHEGTIRVDSAPGQGARFVVALPARVAAPSSPAESPPGPVREAGRPATVLVVDDETEVATMLADILALDGHRVETAPNGAVALERLAARPFDVVISDSAMPVMNGAEFYREVERAHPVLAGRIIFVSGDALNAQTVRFLEAVNPPRLTKPFELDAVRALVRRVAAGD